jgi:hypothetical protein
MNLTTNNVSTKKTVLKLNPLNNPLDSSSTITNSLISNNDNSSNLVQTTFDKDLTQLLLQNLNVPTYNLTKDQINWIKLFIENSPGPLNDLQKDILSITTSGKIGLDNIPKIVKLCADVYKRISISQNICNSENIIDFIKYTLYVIINSKFVTLFDIKNEVIEKLIDTSLNLLSMSIDINTIKQEIPMIILNNDNEKTSSFFSKCFKCFRY